MATNLESSENVTDLVYDIRSKEYVYKFKEISDNFEIIDKIGEGSFATVFLVKSKKDPTLREKFALKFNVPIIDSKRILNELRILKKIGGRKNVIKLHLAFRVKDHVFMLMPCVDHSKFVDYYLTMDIKEIREYFRNLLIALMHVHSNKIIHRDVKPNNFLYDRERKKFALVDFGLAHSEQYGDLGDWFDDENVDVSNDKLSMAHDKSSNGQKSRVVSLASQLSDTNGVNRFGQTLNSTSCVCGHRLTTCSGCRNRPRPNARRGGTIGYRPPEVMMFHAEQTTAVDVWAVGIILAMFLTGNYPMFKAEDDAEMLYNLVYFLSFEKMQEGAKAIERHILIDPKPKPFLGQFDYWLQSRCSFIRQHNPKVSKLFSGASNPACIYGPDHVFHESAYDLLSHLLDPVFRTRFTCQQALKHRFFTKNFS